MGYFVRLKEALLGLLGDVHCAERMGHYTIQGGRGSGVAAKRVGRLFGKCGLFVGTSVDVGKRGVISTVKVWHFLIGVVMREDQCPCSSASD